MIDFFVSTGVLEIGMDKQAINDFLNRTRGVTKLYIRDSQNLNFEEHIIIREQKQYSLNKTRQSIKK